MSETEKLLVNTKVAAEMLSVSTRKIQQLQASGELKPIRIGRSVRFSVESLREWVLKASNS